MDTRQLLNKICEARKHYQQYVKLTNEIEQYIEEKYRATLGYRYAGEEFPQNEEIEAEKAVYTVPATVETENGRICGELCILESGRAALVVLETGEFGKIRRKIIWL